MKQQSFEKINWQHKYSYGGLLRQKQAGRKARPLSSKNSIHLIFKANREYIRGGFRTHRRFQLLHAIVQKYSRHFWVRIEQISIQGDHIHILIRCYRRSKYLDFFRVVAGQIAQRFQQEGLMIRHHAMTDTPRNGEKVARTQVKLWKYRPFTRVVVGWKAYKTVRDYVQLNEQEILGKIPYRKERLKGLSSTEWEILWS
jgi:putative transposase